jgi:hypothetical protein
MRSSRRLVFIRRLTWDDPADTIWQSTGQPGPRLYLTFYQLVN